MLSDTPTLVQLSSLQTLHLDHHYVCAGSEGNAVQSYPNQICIWTALKNTNIRLKSITSNRVSMGLIDYLASYDGVLENLVLKESWYDEIPVSNSQANRFFTDALPRHQSSLRCLEVQPCTRGRWCFEAGNEECLSDLWPELVTLNVGIYTGPQALEPNDEDPLVSHIRVILVQATMANATYRNISYCGPFSIASCPSLKNLACRLSRK